MTRFLAIFAFVIWNALPATAEIAVQEVTSDGGIKAWLVQESSIPIIAMQVSFRGGTSLDQPDKLGATNLMAGLLEEGTGDMDAAAFLRRTEELAARFSFDASRDSITVTAQVLRENSGRALHLFKQAITNPAFNDVAFARVQAQVISILQSNLTDPYQIAYREMDERGFGDHPYGRPGVGTIETVSKLTPLDIVAAHKAGMTRDRMFVSVVGDISAEELGPMLDEVLGDLPETGAPLPPKTAFAATGGTTVVEFDTPQSVALWAQPGIGRDDPDFFAAYVMNHILGGGSFSSRLTEEVREKRGLTYGVYSYLAPYDLGSVVYGSVASANDRIGQAIDVVREEWKKMAEQGATAEELAAAQKFLTGAYPLRFDGNRRIAGILTGMQLNDQPIDYIATRNQQIEAVTLADIKRVAGYLLQPDNLRFVVVGKPAGVESTD